VSENQFLSQSTDRILHVICPYAGDSPLRERQAMFLESVRRARNANVVLIAGTDTGWHSAGWEVCDIVRTAASMGDRSDKPFLKDLLDLALAQSSPNDWLLYSNVDCSFAPDLYRDLEGRRATVVEYQRQDVDGNPQTLDEMLARGGVRYSIGLDAIAIRASLYREIRGELPDFVVGEPHWDTIYSGFFRRLVPVQRDVDRLFHPKHRQVWDLAHPTHAGSHNQHLFEESLTRGLAEKSMITDTPDRTDTAVIVAVFGNDPQRIEANAAGLREQLKQDLYADFFLVELVRDGVASSYPEDLLRMVRHIAIPASEPSDGLFQKEALYNRGWRAALAQSPYEYFLFLDADVYCDRRDWFRQVRSRLQENPARAVQGWRTVRDTVDPALLFSSVGAAFALNQPTDLPLNPGLCWGLHRELLEAGDGFNPYCVDCAGDSAFVAEYLNTPKQQYDPWLYQWTWFREIERPLPFHAEIDCVPLDLVHVHHGPLQERNYDGFRYALDAFPPLMELVQLNSQGILEWRDRECPEREILRHRSRMHSRAAVDDLLSRLSYVRYSQPRTSGRHRIAAKRPFQFRCHSGRRAGAVVRPHTRKDLAGIKIFDPQQVFRKDFPFSWCDGVVKDPTSTYVPLVSADCGAVLVLKGNPDTTFVVCALPLEPTWQPQDISSRTKLRFGIRVEGGPPDVLVTLVSIDSAGSETESAEQSLRVEGLEYGRWMDVSVPLERFQHSVDLTSIRLVKFVGYASFRLDLRQIYIQ
jgi:hypothetical protein